jgi:hypothetical protein
MSKPVILSFFAQSPDHKVLTYLDEESKFVKAAWRQHSEDNKKDYYEVQYFDSQYTTIEEIPDQLSKYKEIVLLHYGGHAGNQKIFLNDGIGHAVGLAGLVGGIATLKLVFLNGCATYDQVALLFDKGVKAVIATNNAISDPKAKKFASDFYNELSKAGKTIQEAYNFAMNSLALNDGINREERMVWDRGFITEKKDNSPLWQLFVKQGYEKLLDDPYWWVIGNLALSQPPPKHAALPKLFFIYNESAREDYKVFKDELYPKIVREKLLINGIYDIQSTLNTIAIKAEINAADVVFILIRNNEFIEFWKSLDLKAENFVDKFVVFVKISDPDFSLEILNNEGIEASAIIPPKRWSNSFSVLDKAPNDLKKLMFSDVFVETIENVIDVLPKYIREFNFTIPKREFENTLKSNQKILFTYIEGTPTCGQNMLLRKFEEKLTEVNKSVNKIKIPLKINFLQIGNELEPLEVLVSENLKINGNLYAGLSDLNQREHVIIIFDDFLFQDNAGESLVDTQAKLILKFFTKLQTELANNEMVNTILIVLVNRHYKGNSILRSDDLSDRLSTLCCQINPVKYEEIITWKKDKDPADRILKELLPDKLNLNWPSYMEPTIMAIGKQLRIPSKVLATIFE